MKKVLVLIKKKDALKHMTATGYLAKYLKEDVDVTRDYLGYVNYSFDYQEGKMSGKIGDKKLEDFDLIYLRTVGMMKDQAFVLANYCKKNNIPIIEDNFLVTNSNSKLIQLYKLFDGDVSVPKSFYYGEWPPKFGINDFPIVMKSVLGKGGDGVYLVKSNKEISEIMESNEDREFIYQEYVPNDYDWRIVVIGDKAVYSCKRVRDKKEKFRNNVKLGAQEVIEEAPKEINKLAISAAKSCGLTVAGVDIIHGEEGHYVIEVNRSPSFTTDLDFSDEIPELGEYIKKCLK